MTSDSANADIFETDVYWQQTRRPLACLVFLAPILAIYEAGILLLGGREPDTIRNGADYWMRGWLQQLGFNHALLLPGIVIGGLLVWQLTGKYSWRVSIDTLVGMFAESLLFAFVLVVIGQLVDTFFQQIGEPVAMGIAGASSLAKAITFIGAGVYEEVMFRLALLPACYGLFRLMRLDGKSSACLAILGTSLMFSLAHYVGPSADTLTLFSFAFRALAGMFFACLFVARGFGITVGCHTAYDLLVGVLLYSDR